MFKISEVSRSLGINPQTLYFYERIGLIPSPQRTEAGYRLFSQLDIDRLAFISRAKSLGLSLDDIKEILSLKEGKLLTCKAVYERLSKKVKEIEENIDQLRSLLLIYYGVVGRIEEGLIRCDWFPEKKKKSC